MSARLRYLKGLETALVERLDDVRSELASERRKLEAKAEAKARAEEAKLTERRRREEAKRRREIERAARAAERKQERAAVAADRKRKAERKRDAERAARNADARKRREKVASMFKPVIEAVAVAATEHYGTPITVQAILAHGAHEKLEAARSAATWIAREKLGLNHREAGECLRRSTASAWQRADRPLSISAANIVHGALLRLAAEAKARSEDLAEPSVDVGRGVQVAVGDS